MKKLAFVCLLAGLALTAFYSCKKSKADSEPILTVETNPANKSTNLNILGPDFPLKVEITSAMPASGVKIEVVAATEGSTTNFYTSSSNSTAQQNDYAISNTPSGATCIVNITVTSLSQPSNVWRGTYRYSKK